MKSENENLDIVLTKLRKLQILYEGAKKINSEGEAAAAAFLINRLLTQYNLTMEQIGTEPKDDPVLHEYASGFTYKSIGGEWEQRLTWVLCKYNYCRCFVYGSSYKKLLLVGKKENLEMVKWLRDMLSERYVQCSKEKYKEYLKGLCDWQKPMSKDKYQRGYLMGCAAGLDIKLKEESEREKKEDEILATKITALVVKNDAALDTYVAEKFGKTGVRHTRQSGSVSAYNEGVKDGKNTEIYKPISDSTYKAASKVNLLG